MRSRKANKPKLKPLDVERLRESVTQMAYQLGLIRPITARIKLPAWNEFVPCTTRQAWEWVDNG